MTTRTIKDLSGRSVPVAEIKRRTIRGDPTRDDLGSYWQRTEDRIERWNGTTLETIVRTQRIRADVAREWRAFAGGSSRLSCSLPWLPVARR